MKILLIWCCLFSALLLNAQTATVKGSVSDSSGIQLPAVSVVLLRSADSVMSTFGLADPNGAFALRRVKPGNYLLQLSYVGYETLYQPLQVQADQPVYDLGLLKMYPSSTLLHAVDVSAERAPMSVRKDTLEYNAAAFKTQPGDVVEDLLKKLPGVEVQADGSIKALGETVTNVMVDGKEFFGKDPKMATKNLPADAIDRVQVFDKKSERAEFTGIEDGRDERSINLKLKEDKKNGYFGNVSAGYGSNNRYSGRFNLNRFAPKGQFSAIGLGNNNNDEGFSFEDYMNFMGGLSNLMSGGGGGGGRMRISLNAEDGLPIGNFNNNGINTSWAGGLNFNKDFSKKTELSANYMYNRIENDLLSSSTRDNLLGTSLFRSTDADDQLSRNANHRLNITLKHQLDSFQRLTLRLRGSLNDAVFNSLSESRSFNPDGALQNSGDRDYRSAGDNLRADAGLTYRRRFRAKGRALVADLFYQNTSDHRDGNLMAINRFYNTAPILEEQLRQRQDYSDNYQGYNAGLSYTEPLGKGKYLEILARRQGDLNRTDKLFYDVDSAPTPGEIYNPNLSNRFSRGYTYDRATLNFLLNRKKWNLTAGAALQNARLDGEILEKDLSPIRQDFLGLLPAVFLNVEPGLGRNWSLEYSTALNAPTLEQLAPVIDNSNPLSTYTGNPDLKPEYAHNLDFSFMRFDQFSMSGFFVTLNGVYTRNRVTNAGQIDSLFRRNLRPVNVEHDWQARGYISYNTPLRFIKTNFSVSLNNNYNRTLIFVNDQENVVNRWENALELKFDNRKKTYFDLNLGARLSLNDTRYDRAANLNQQFLNQRWFTDLRVFAGKKWTFQSGFDYNVYSGQGFSERLAIPIWRAAVTRYVLPNNKGRIILSAFDLLNRNEGIYRTANLNFIQERRVRNLTQYVMLSFAYSIAGFKQKNEGVLEFNFGG